MFERERKDNRKVGVRTHPVIDSPSLSNLKRGVPLNSFGIGPMRLFFPTTIVDGDV